LSVTTVCYHIFFNR